METKRKYEIEALEYISKLSDGGMRDAITMLDKCLAYDTNLTLENVVKVIGGVDYQTMMSLTNNILDKKVTEAIDTIDTLYDSGKDLKLFIRQYINFIIEVNKKIVGVKNISIPMTKDIEKWFKSLSDDDCYIVLDLLDELVKLNANIKYSQAVKADIEASLMLFMMKGEEK